MCFKIYFVVYYYVQSDPLKVNIWYQLFGTMLILIIPFYFLLVSPVRLLQLFIMMFSNAIHCLWVFQTRLVSSEISRGKFSEIYLTGNLLENFFTLYVLIIIKYKINNKHMFLTNNSSDLCVLTLCIMFRKNNLFFVRLQRILANSNENYRTYSFQALANISGNFRKY